MLSRSSRRAGIVVLICLLSACTSVTPGTGSRAIQPSGSPTAPPTTKPNEPTVDPATFSDCSDLFNLDAAGIPSSRMRKLEFGCGRVEVPLDYTKPDGERINIQLIRVHHKDQKDKIGSLLVNPGGPGASGVFLAIGLVRDISEDILERFDIIGFDPRGVALSTPIECVSAAEKDRLIALMPDVLTPAGYKQAQDSAKGVAKACSDKVGEDLEFFNTESTARDMDLIRRSVGDPKLNYLGYSYGTELGGAYAHLFPDNIRAAVLDGAVDPLTDDITSFENQVKGFEHAFDQFAADCATRANCRSLGNLRTVVGNLVKQANTTPLKSSNSNETRRATGGIVMYGVLAALYDQQSWPQLESAIRQAVNGDAEGLFSLSDLYNDRTEDGSYSNIMDANTTINCNDTPPGPTDEKAKATAAKWVKDFPLFGAWAAGGLFSCQSWQPNRHPLELPTAPTSKPILVIGTVHDPATPYSGAISLAKTLESGVLLTWEGEGHTAYGKTSCIDDKVEAYLISLTVPPANTRCPA